MSEQKNERTLSVAPPPANEITVRLVVVSVFRRPQFTHDFYDGPVLKARAYGIPVESCTAYDPLSGEAIENLPCAGMGLMDRVQPGTKTVLEVTVRRLVPVPPVNVNTPTGPSLPAGVELAPDDGWDICGTCCGKGWHDHFGHRQQCGQCKGKGRAPLGGLGQVGEIS